MKLKLDVNARTVALAVVLVGGALGAIALGYSEVGVLFTLVGTLLRSGE